MIKTAVISLIDLESSRRANVGNEAYYSFSSVLFFFLLIDRNLTLRDVFIFQENNFLKYKIAEILVYVKNMPILEEFITHYSYS